MPTCRSGPQTGVQLVTIAGSISAEAGQHFLRVGADLSGLCPGGPVPAGGA